MPSIRIQNIGPLMDTGTVDIKSITLFIGKQGTGKSTLMKILCFCQWLEKRIASDLKEEEESVMYSFSHGGRFIAQLISFFRFNEEFFSPKSVIDYEGTSIRVHFNGEESHDVRIELVRNPLVKYNSKLSFIPSERNLVTAIKNIQNSYLSSQRDMVFNFIFEWAEFKESFSSTNPLQLAVVTDMDYYFDKTRGELVKLNHPHSGDLAPFSPFYASSGVQSALPMEVMVSAITDSVGSKVKVSQAYLALLGLQMDQVSVYSAEEISKKLLTYQSAHLFVEEPEQNLFPESQMRVIKEFVSSIKKADLKSPDFASSLVMTTHSPYILSAINLLMAASEAFEIDADKTSEIIPKDYILPKGSIAAYYLTENGFVENIVDSEVYMVSGIELDGVSQEVENGISRLTDIILSSN